MYIPDVSQLNIRTVLEFGNIFRQDWTKDDQINQSDLRAQLYR